MKELPDYPFQFSPKFNLTFEATAPLVALVGAVEGTIMSNTMDGAGFLNKEPAHGSHSNSIQFNFVN